MEVHHHPHVEKKNFKEYFLEFLMIFLAVTMGFIAENIREHYTEKNDAREYLESYRDELLQELSVFSVYMHGTKKGILGADEELKTAGAELIEYLQKEYHLKDE